MAKPLTDAITALTTYANTVTGASDTTLSEAVATLANGYGGGGNREAEILSGSISGAYTNNDVTSLKAYALFGCTNLTYVTMHSLTTIGNNAFQNDNRLTGIDMPLLRTVGNYVFNNCTALNDISLPSIQTVGNNMFEGCTSLTNIKLPQATRLNNSCFRRCKFSTVVFPLVTIADQNCLSANILTSADFTAITQMNGQWGLADNANLATLIIRNADAVPTLGNISWFNNTPFASGKAGGTLYVPSALISSYQSATNWSTILGYANNQILPIEGSIYETQYADGTPIE